MEQKDRVLGKRSKITRAKRAGGMAKVVELLPHKCEALISNSITNKELGNSLSNVN
jgi:hypothetical protein